MSEICPMCGGPLPAAGRYLRVLRRSMRKDYLGGKADKYFNYSYGWHGDRDPRGDETPTGYYLNNFGTTLAAEIRGACSMAASDKTSIFVYSTSNLCDSICITSKEWEIPDPALVHYIAQPDEDRQRLEEWAKRTGATVRHIG